MHIIRRANLGTTTNLQIVQKLEYPKNPYLNQATPKILAKFSSPKNPAIEILNPKRSFDQPHHLKSGVPHWGNV